MRRQPVQSAKQKKTQIYFKSTKSIFFCSVPSRDFRCVGQDKEEAFFCKCECYHEFLARETLIIGCEYIFLPLQKKTRNDKHVCDSRTPKARHLKVVEEYRRRRRGDGRAHYELFEEKQKTKQTHI